MEERQMRKFRVRCSEDDSIEVEDMAITPYDRDCKAVGILMSFPEVAGIMDYDDVAELHQYLGRWLRFFETKGREGWKEVFSRKTGPGNELETGCFDMKLVGAVNSIASFKKPIAEMNSNGRI